MRFLSCMVLMFGMATAGWESESLAAIRQRMTTAESAAVARRTDSLDRTRQFNRVRMGDSVEFDNYDGTVIAVCDHSLRWQGMVYEGPSRGIERMDGEYCPAGRCLLVETYQAFTPFSDNGGGWGPRYGYFVIWWDEVESRSFSALRHSR